MPCGSPTIRRSGLRRRSAPAIELKRMNQKTNQNNPLGEELHMAHLVNAGARLDRLPISSFHYRIFGLVGAGMFFDGYDLYVAGGVLASAIQTKFTTAPQNLQFISLTFVGMTLGALITGFVGGKLGRRFTYQLKLPIVGCASLAAAFA